MPFQIDAVREKAESGKPKAEGNCRSYRLSAFRFRLALLGSLLFCVTATSAMAESKSDQIPALIKALDNADVRYGASLALTKLGTDAVPALRKSLAAGKGDTAVWAAYTLGQIGPQAKSAVDDLSKALTSSDSALRAATAQALGKIGPSASAAVDPLANALSDEQQDVRMQAIVALGKIGPSAKNATGKLIGTLSDSQLRKPARAALIQIGSATVAPLLESLKNDNIRFDVSLVLLQVDAKAAQQAGLDKATEADVAALRLVLNDPTRVPAERTAAAEALASVGKAGISVLLVAFEEETYARTAAEAFAKSGPVAVPVLIETLSHKTPAVRSFTADALGHIGLAANAATPQLIKMLKDPDRDVRYHVVRALHTFGKKATPALPTLIEVLNNNSEAEATRQWAVKTMILTLPETHEVVIKALITASKEKNDYGISQLARQKARELDLKAAETAGVK
jgi:HEAT repeat protein